MNWHARCGRRGDVIVEEEELSAAALAAAPPGLQKQMIGEKLLPLVSEFWPELAGRITGRLLEENNSERAIEFFNRAIQCLRQ